MLQLHLRHRGDVVYASQDGISLERYGVRKIMPWNAVKEVVNNGLAIRLVGEETTIIFGKGIGGFRELMALIRRHAPDGTRFRYAVEKSILIGPM